MLSAEQYIFCSVVAFSFCLLLIYEANIDHGHQQIPDKYLRVDALKASTQTNISIAHGDDKSGISRVSDSETAKELSPMQNASASFTPIASLGEFLYSPNEYAYDQTIFTDWNYDSDVFSLVNYRTLESLLRVYPRARIEVLITAPIMANYYKWRNRIR